MYSGQDGSREVTSAKVDTTGTGNSFAATATVTKNGIKAPTDVTSQQLTLSLPAGTKCTGGVDKASCLVSLTTAGGFGNCVLVSQGTGAAAAATNTGVKNGANANAAAATTGKKNQNKQAKQARAYVSLYSFVLFLLMIITQFVFLFIYE